MKEILEFCKINIKMKTLANMKWRTSSFHSDIEELMKSNSNKYSPLWIYLLKDYQSFFPFSKKE